MGEEDWKRIGKKTIFENGITEPKTLCADEIIDRKWERRKERNKEVRKEKERYVTPQGGCWPDVCA